MIELMWRLPTWITTGRFGWTTRIWSNKLDSIRLEFESWKTRIIQKGTAALPQRWSTRMLSKTLEVVGLKTWLVLGFFLLLSFISLVRL